MSSRLPSFWGCDVMPWVPENMLMAHVPRAALQSAVSLQASVHSATSFPPWGPAQECLSLHGMFQFCHQHTFQTVCGCRAMRSPATGHMMWTVRLLPPPCVRDLAIWVLGVARCRDRILLCCSEEQAFMLCALRSESPCLHGEWQSQSQASVPMCGSFMRVLQLNTVMKGICSGTALL